MQTAKTYLKSLQQGAICLTATNRLARQVMSDYDRIMVASGQSVWSRPTIQSLDFWCSNLAGTVAPTRLILTRDQSRFLWENIIQHDIEATDHQLLQVAPTANKASQANKLLLEYMTSFSPDDATDDHRAFLRWHRSWNKWLESRGWVDPDSLLTRIVDSLNRGDIRPEGPFILLGFDDFNPIQLALIEALRQSGCQVEIPRPPHIVSLSRKVLTAVDLADEVEQCARWVRQIVISETDASIGIVAPQLELYRDLILRKFHAELDPKDYAAGTDQTLPFNISLGSKLSGEGPVFAAMKLFSIANPVPLDELTWLLRTPYIASAESNRARRGRADFQLRRKRIADFPLWKVRGILRSSGCDDEAGAVIDAIVLFQKLGRKMLPGAWAEKMAEMLQACGWPGDRTMSSREYQVIAKFRELLSSMASLDTVSGPINRTAAVSLMQRLARESNFQAESAGSRVQVLGLLEAGGLEFDHLWVLGMHAGAMPLPIRPNPFIPIALQRHTRMPHADANRELEYAVRLVDRLLASARQIIISWPQRESGIENRRSLLFDGIDEPYLAGLPTVAPAAILFQSAPALEIITDCSAQALASNKPVSGGTAIVKDQALCPFRAFAHHRLRASGLEESDIGLDNMTRGTLVHSTLEYFWGKVVTQTKFCQLSESEITALLKEAAEKAITRLEQQNKSDIPVRLRLVEADRLVGQALKWLELERKRSPFEVIEQEELHEETIGRLHFRTRIDRIDRLADGTLAIIDYKTGLPDPLQWFEERISEPQLPIYCQGTSNAEIGAVLFAVVRNRERECRFSGIAREADGFPRLNEKRLQTLLAEKGWQTIDQVLDHWKTVLPELGNAFVRGEASVDPVDHEIACKYCDLTALCRIHEKELWPLWGAGHD